jgi:hypothetical protein
MNKEREEGWEAIEAHARALSYPPALVKACSDPFGYRLRLRTGEAIDFSQAKAIDREWVHLDADGLRGIDVVGERGVNVRVADIVWVCDGGR